VCHDIPAERALRSHATRSDHQVALQHVYDRDFLDAEVGSDFPLHPMVTRSSVKQARTSNPDRHLYVASSVQSRRWFAARSGEIVPRPIGVECGLLTVNHGGNKAATPKCRNIWVLRFKEFI
jgi:hypothetical protein